MFPLEALPERARFWFEAVPFKDEAGGKRDELLPDEPKKPNGPPPPTLSPRFRPVPGRAIEDDRLSGLSKRAPNSLTSGRPSVTLGGAEGVCPLPAVVAALALRLIARLTPPPPPCPLLPPPLPPLKKLPIEPKTLDRVDVVALSAVAGRPCVARWTACGSVPIEVAPGRDGTARAVVAIVESAVGDDLRSEASECDRAARVLMSVLASDVVEGLVDGGPAIGVFAIIVDVDAVSGFSSSLLGDASGEGVKGAEDPPAIYPRRGEFGFGNPYELLRGRSTGGLEALSSSRADSSVSDAVDAPGIRICRVDAESVEGACCSEGGLGNTCSAFAGRRMTVLSVSGGSSAGVKATTGDAGPGDPSTGVVEIETRGRGSRRFSGEEVGECVEKPQDIRYRSFEKCSDGSDGKAGRPVGAGPGKVEEEVP